LRAGFHADVGGGKTFSIRVIREIAVPISVAGFNALSLVDLEP
jgi:hypothetical protein